MDITSFARSILVNQFRISFEPLFLHYSIFIERQVSDDGKEEITIIESNKKILKENQNKEQDNIISFSILNKSDQLDNFIKIAENLIIN